MTLCLLSLASPAGAQAPVLSLPPGTIAVSPIQTGTTYAQVTLTVPTGTPYSVWSTTYNGWCINPEASLEAYSATPYSSYDPALPADEGTAVQWQEVNWVLNHKQGNSGTLTTTMADIQKVIWRLLFSTSVYNGGLSPAATTLLSDATTYGPGFVPGPGQIMAVVLYAYGIEDPANQNAAVPQDLIIEVTVGGQIGDFVWNNVAQNGLQNSGEPGINGVTVQLYSGSTLVATTVTANAPAGYPYAGPNPAGYYQFTGLSAGAYTVVIPAQSALSGMYPTLSLQGNNPAVDSNGVAGANGSTVATVTLATNWSVDETIDFGFYSAPAVTLTCPPTASVMQGSYYSSALVATGAIAPEVFSITSGALPTGVTLDAASGALAGTATAPGTYSFGAQVVDSRNNSAGTATASCGIAVLAPPSANCVSIAAVQGVAIAPATMTGSGGAGGPYTFTATGLPAGLTISSSGTISGTPSVSGTFSYTVTVKDQAGNTGTVNCSVTVAPPPTATCVSITAVQGVAIAPVAMTGSGGSGGPYTFTATGLPAGLTISSSGTISGTPTVSGTFSYTVTVKDQAGNTGTVNCSVTVAPPPTATCVSITAVQGVAITPVTMTGSGGAGGPYTFTATGLPAGLTISSSGTISGTPTASGTFSYTVTVKDQAGNTGTANCSVTVAPPVTAGCTCMKAVLGVAITPVTLTASGGAGGPYTFAATGLPAGLTISSSGTISGTPTAGGTFNYTVAVRDKNGNLGTVNCSVTVSVPAVTVNCTCMKATQGVAITPVTLTASGGAGGPYTFTATGLPAGLTISSSGTISGTPTVSGTFSYTVTAKDQAGNTGTANCSVTVAQSSIVPPTACLYALDTTADRSFQVDDDALRETACNVVVESSASDAFYMEGAVKFLLANHAQVGLVGGASFTGQTELWNTITNTQEQPIKISNPGDPLASLTAPTTGSIVSAKPVSYDMNNRPANNTLQPGVYCGGLSIGNTNGATYTLNPGTYIMAGGGFTVNGPATVKGTGVTIYNTSSGGWGCSASYSYKPIGVNGSSTVVNLSAPTTGSLAQVLFFGNRTGCSAVNSCVDQIGGSATATFNGALYFKSDEFLVTGATLTGNMVIVADTIVTNGAAVFNDTGNPFD
jgi:hypothetical protein